MPWKEKDKSTMREEFVKKALSGKYSKSALCREYGISRPTGDEWIRRYQAGLSMQDRSHRPNSVPNKTSPEVENAIIHYRTQFPAIGAMKLRRMMLNDGYTNLPCMKTFNNIFQRNKLITKEASLAATPYTHFQRSRPNELLQGDFKIFRLGNGEQCHALNITDDYSRFCLCSRGLKNERFETVQPVFLEVFSEYGLPDTFLCDNGNPWGTVQSTGYTIFEVWLMELGVLTIHGRPLHPQTQGKAERFNGSLKKEWLKYHSFADMAEAQRGLDEYREFYNNRRPHHALQLDTPSQHYSPSLRMPPNKIEPWEYDQGFTVCKVKDTGYITYKGQGYFLSEGFRGKEVAIRESAIPGLLTVVFRQFRIARIDPDKRVFVLKKASWLDQDHLLNV